MLDPNEVVDGQTIYPTEWPIHVYGGRRATARLRRGMRQWLLGSVCTDGRILWWDMPSPPK